MYDVLVVGCGLAGMVIARTLADQGYKILIVDKRKQIGGNIYDRMSSAGFLIQEYGPHCFFTNDDRIRPFVEKYIDTEDCFVKCRTVIDGKKIPMPFNYESIDIIYDKKMAEQLKRHLEKEFEGREIVSVTELLDSSDSIIKEYGAYMYNNEYKLYSSKQWGLDISSISPAVFQRVPVYLSYKDAYQSHQYQFMPQGGFTKFSKALLDTPNIEIILEKDAIKDGVIKLDKNHILVDQKISSEQIPIVYTGELDELFAYKYGKLPYRSLEFIWKTLDIEEYQETEIVAFPQTDKITRITEYKKLPKQEKKGCTQISIEIPVPYDKTQPIGTEPYYPIKNDVNDELYMKYAEDAKEIEQLYLCGRLAEYKYYNMDMVISNAWDIAEKIAEEMK